MDLTAPEIEAILATLRAGLTNNAAEVSHADRSVRYVPMDDRLKAIAHYEELLASANAAASDTPVRRKQVFAVTRSGW